MTDKLLAEWFWVDRWVGSRAFALPIDARGLYREMLSQAWRRQARLPNDPEQIRRLTGVTLKEWRKAWPLVAPFWRVDGDALVNDTQLDVYAETLRLMDARSRAGKAGNAKRWGERQPINLLATALQTASQTPRKPIANPIAKPIANASPPISDLRSPSPVVPPEPHKERRLDVTPEQEALELRAGELLERYAELFTLHRKGARYHNRMHLDYPKALELVHTWTDDARLEKLAVLILTTNDEWIANTDRGFGVFAAKASWADDKLVAWEAKQGTA